ncbi:MAG: hypothetical protein ACYTEQ_25700 [Planctomycetota bacterium]|jgi:hypothetical protein
MTDDCGVSLHKKIGDRAGRLQLIVAAMADLARVAAQDNVDEEMINSASEQFLVMAVEYGPSWCDEAADLLKNWYNRRSGP